MKNYNFQALISLTQEEIEHQNLEVGLVVGLASDSYLLISSYRQMVYDANGVIGLLCRTKVYSRSRAIELEGILDIICLNSMLSIGFLEYLSKMTFQRLFEVLQQRIHHFL